MPTRTYWFKAATTTQTSGDYSAHMRSKCSEFGMKPVCDHPNYCRNDGNAIYIGQDHHIAHTPHRNENSYMPGGFSAIKDKFDNLCLYTAHHLNNEHHLF